MELEKFSCNAEDPNVLFSSSSGLVIRTCVAQVPPGFKRLELNPMGDEIWGVDGFDT
jgi:hypothetical protein